MKTNMKFKLKNIIALSVFCFTSLTCSFAQMAADKAKSLLELTDYCMLDIKYTNDADYIKYTGISMKQPLEFLDYLNKNNICGVVSLRDNSTDFKSLMVRILSKSRVKLDKAEILDFMASEGYIVQRRYSEIDSVIKAAKILKNN